MESINTLKSDLIERMNRYCEGGGTIRSLAEKSGVSRNTLFSLRNARARTNPTADTLCRLHQALLEFEGKAQ